MTSNFDPIFLRLRSILSKHAGTFSVREAGPGHYSLEAPAGPAAVQAWHGKLERPVIPVAWVQVGKNYVSYHLMGVYANPKLLDSVSKQLRSHVQGKSCFNFKAEDDALFAELDQLTAQAIAGFKKGGYVAEPPRG
jgi:hypothetical protein